MPLPQVRLGGLGDEVLAAVLIQHQRGELRQPRHAGFVGQPGNIGAGLLFGGDHAASLRRAWTSSAESAAGVTPGTRPAAASVPGAALVRRSTISFERPGTSP